MNHLELSIGVRFATNFHTTGNRLDPEADKALARSADGLIIIPATHVKGVLRAAAETALHTWNQSTCHGPSPDTMCTSVQALCPVCRVFGNAHARSALRFGNLILPEADKDDLTQVRSGVSISRQRRTSLAQRLYFIETAQSSGQHWVGSASGLFSTTQEAIQAAALVILAASLNPQMGGGRSRGLGWVDYWQVTASVDGAPLSMQESQAVWATWSGKERA